MKSSMKLSLLTVAGCFVAMSSSAEVIPIRDYIARFLGVNSHNRNLNSNSNNGAITCSSRGYYESDLTSNAGGITCVSKRIDGNKLCYSCTCDTTTYPFTSADCKSEGFKVPSGNVCTLPATSKSSETRYYSTCACNESRGFYDKQVVHEKAIAESYPFMATGEFYKTITAGSKSVVCVNSKLFDCADGSGKNIDKETPLGDITITYKTVDLLRTSGVGNFKCTEDVLEISGTGVFRDSGKMESCVKQNMGETRYYNSSKSYERYYFYDINTGTKGCETSKICSYSADSSDDCALWDSTKPVKDYKGNEIICKRIIGCKSGGDCYGFLKSSQFFKYVDEDEIVEKIDQDLTTIPVTKIRHGDYNCMRIKDCGEGNQKIVNFDVESESEPSVNHDKFINVIKGVNRGPNNGIFYETRGIKTENDDKVQGIICNIPKSCDVSNNYYDIESHWIRHFSSKDED